MATQNYYFYLSKTIFSLFTHLLLFYDYKTTILSALECKISSAALIQILGFCLPNRECMLIIIIVIIIIYLFFFGGGGEGKIRKICFLPPIRFTSGTARVTCVRGQITLLCCR